MIAKEAYNLMSVIVGTDNYANDIHMVYYKGAYLTAKKHKIHKCIPAYYTIKVTCGAFVIPRKLRNATTRRFIKAHKGEQNDRT